MKTILVTAAFFAAILCGNTQSLKKYAVSNSGCSLYCFCEPKYEIDYSKDSSKVYTGECTLDDITYGSICIKLVNPVNDLFAAENLMISYLSYLKGSFNIIKAAGYGKGHHLNNDENTRGILDYWEDKEKNNWKVKAWTDGKFIGVLYTYSQKALLKTNVNLFLDSFRMPKK